MEVLHPKFVYNDSVHNGQKQESYGEVDFFPSFAFISVLFIFV